jgi:hypothetical protein
VEQDEEHVPVLAYRQRALPHLAERHAVHMLYPGPNLIMWSSLTGDR